MKFAISVFAMVACGYGSSNAAWAAPPPVGRPFYWELPVSRTRLSFVPRRVIVNRTFTSEDTALFADNGAFNNTVFYGCTFEGGRYAVWLSNQQNVAFIDCLFDNTADAPDGMNEEAAIRIQDSRRIYFSNITVRNGAPKHAFRVHKQSSQIGVAGADIDSWGNGFMFGTYPGAREASLVEDLEFADVHATVAGPDYFNAGARGSLIGLRIRDMVLVPGRSTSWSPPTSASGRSLDWYIDNFTRR